jgi:UPF0755 protein
MHRRATMIAAATAAVLLGAAAGLGWSLHRKGPPLQEPVVVHVAQGDRPADVARRLVERGLLRSTHPFVLWARLTGRDREIRTGDFRIATGLSPVALLNLLTGPPNALQAVTIPEGLTVREVVARLADAGLGSEDSFLGLLADPAFIASEGLPAGGAEGYLFPDTYSFESGTPPDRILRVMIRRFRDVFTADMVARASRIGLDGHQAVTLASLVEEETARADERPLVAAVFVNRLRKGMPLQADPTVLYGRQNGDRRIRRSDLARPTPHNTYTSTGLPPTPISNPGRAALEAACAPADVPYLYFVARGDGSHEFNVELGSHNQAVARLRQLERTRSQ